MEVRLLVKEQYVEMITRIILKIIEVREQPRISSNDQTASGDTLNVFFSKSLR
jgi:hypothetical protein